MFFKMTEKVHPHGIMADFVNRYQDIRKALEKENKKLATIFIRDVYSRFNISLKASNMIINSNPEAYWQYVSAVSILYNLGIEEISQKTLNFMLPEVDKDVAELERILQNDENYKKYRRKEN